MLMINSLHSNLTCEWELGVLPPTRKPSTHKHNPNTGLELRRISLVILLESPRFVLDDSGPSVQAHTLLLQLGHSLTC
jgi:hypothetical protein